jgi:Carbohydrate family 9 binding domain-like
MTNARPATTLILATACCVAPLAARGDEPPPYHAEVACRWAAKAPVIDGALDDPAWKDAAVIDKFPTFWAGTTPGAAHATTARLVWDAEALYFSAVMTDSELRAFGTKRNDHLWNGDVFEMFFKPSRDKPAYYEFQANPRSVVFEVAFPERGAPVGEFGKLPALGMTVVARSNGTLDKPGDRDVSWTVEGRIPWTAFAPTGGKPAPGAVWSYAICRYDYGPDGTEPVLMSSAPLTKPSFHRHEDYARLKFEGPAKP